MPNSTQSRPKMGKRVQETTPKKRSGSQAQDTATLDHSISQDNQQRFADIQRDWPQAHFTLPQVGDASNVPARIASGTEMVSRDLTPMERWAVESSTQSAWDNVKSVALRIGEQEQRQATGAEDEVGTDDGSWWPCESVGGRSSA